MLVLLSILTSTVLVSCFIRNILIKFHLIYFSMQCLSKKNKKKNSPCNTDKPLCKKKILINQHIQEFWFFEPARDLGIRACLRFMLRYELRNTKKFKHACRTRTLVTRRKSKSWESFIYIQFFILNEKERYLPITASIKAKKSHFSYNIFCCYFEWFFSNLFFFILFQH